MAAPARKLATWADVLAWPEGTHVEVIDGEIHVAPRPAPASNRAQGGLYRYIGGPFDVDGEPGGWWVLIEPDVELGPGQIYVPDVAGWRRSTLPSLPEERPVRVRPDWVCELLSPSTQRFDRVRKADVYLRTGVSHYWILDVPERLLEAFEARDGGWFRLGAFGDGDVVAIAPFEAVRLDVGRLFPPRPEA